MTRCVGAIYRARVARHTMRPPRCKARHSDVDVKDSIKDSTFTSEKDSTRYKARHSDVDVKDSIEYINVCRATCKRLDGVFYI